MPLSYGDLGHDALFGIGVGLLPPVRRPEPACSCELRSLLAPLAPDALTTYWRNPPFSETSSTILRYTALAAELHDQLPLVAYSTTEYSKGMASLTLRRSSPEPSWSFLSDLRIELGGNAVTVDNGWVHCSLPVPQPCPPLLVRELRRLAVVFLADVTSQRWIV